MHGDPESLPNMPYLQWNAQPPGVWSRVEAMVRDGWYGRIRSFYGNAPIPERGFLTWDVALYAQSLGAPIGRFFTAAAILERAGTPEEGP